MAQATPASDSGVCVNHPVKPTSHSANQSCLKWKLRQMSGSAKRAQYLQLMWQITILPEEQATPEPSMRKENRQTPARRRSRTAKHYSKRHMRRLKKQRLEDISNSLNWLQADRMRPVKLIVYNEETKQEETILLNTI